jgi:hypothetical protein
MKTGGKFVLAGLFSMLCFAVNAQSTSTTAVELTSVTLWNANAPTTASHCLNAVSAQTANSCAGAMTDVSWFRFTVPAVTWGSPTASASVRIQVVPTGFDAVVEVFSGTAAAPVFRQCVNTAGSGGTEILRTTPGNPTNFITVPGTEYYVRVSSTTDVASGCFTIGVQYYPGLHLRTSFFPNPNPDNSEPGFSLSDQVRRNISPEGGGPGFNNAVQATRFRFVDASTPGADGCSVVVSGTSAFCVASQAACVCYGTTYNVFVQGQFEGHWAGETFMRAIVMEAQPNTTITSTSLGNIPATSCVTVPTTGFVKARSIAPTAVMEWRWCSDGLPCTFVGPMVAGNTSCYLNEVPCLKFGRTYSVSVRVRVCGVWGPWSAPRCIAVPQMPYAQITNCPTTSVANSTMLWATYIVGVDSYTWLFTPINPGAPMIPIGPAIVVTTSTGTPNFVFVGQANLPNGTYRVQVKPRSTSCGLIQEGDYYIWCIITKGPGTQGMMLEDAGPDEFAPVVESRTVEYYDHVAGKPLEFIELSGREHGVMTFRVLTSGQPGNGKINVLNTSGQLVASHPVAFEEGMAHAGIPVQDLSAGVYLFNYDGDHGSGTTRVLIE